MAVIRPELMIKCTLPVIMAGVIGVRGSSLSHMHAVGSPRSQIYGVVVSVMIANDLKIIMPLYTAFVHLGAGLSVGLSGILACIVSVRG